MQKIKNNFKLLRLGMNLKSGISILLTTGFVCLLCESAQADLVFPAIVNQFMISGVVPSCYSVILAILVLLIESYFLNKFWNKNWFVSFVLAFMINLLSSIAGIFILMRYWFLFIPREITSGIFEYTNMRLGTYLGMIPGYFLTVLVEWILLMLLAKIFFRGKSGLKPLLKLSATMNAFSYLILLLGIAIADILTKGQNFKSF